MQTFQKVLLATAIAGGVAGYELGNHINSATPEQVSSAQDASTVAEAAYYDAAGADVCARTVLKTLVDIDNNFNEVPKSEEQTVAALDRACGSEGQNIHVVIGTNAVQAFGALEQARLDETNAQNHTEFTVSEKFLSTMFGVYVSVAAIGSAGVIDHLVRRSRNGRTQGQQPQGA